MTRTRWFFYVYEGVPTYGSPCRNTRLASGSGPTRLSVKREGQHYLAQYTQEGPAFLVIRKAPARKTKVKSKS